MHIHPPRPDIQSPRVRRTIDSRLVVFGVAASLFLIVSVTDVLCSMRFWTTAHDVHDTFAPINAVVFMALGFSLGYLAR